MKTVYSYKYIQKELVASMTCNAVVRQDMESKFFGNIRKSRGWYIVIPSSGIWHLHKCGTVKGGVIADSLEPAFWDSEAEARSFLDEWKQKKIKYLIV